MPTLRWLAGRWSMARAVDQHAAGGLADEARDDAQQGGLAAAGRAEQRHDLARLDGERDAVDGQRLAVADGQVVDVERARRGPGRGRRRLSAVDRLHAACLLRPEGGKARAKPVKPGLAQLAHRDGGVGHAVGEAPFVVVPGHDPDELAVHDLGLVHVRRSRSAESWLKSIETLGCVGPAEDALELVGGGQLRPPC